MKLVTDESMRANRRAEVLQEDNLVLPRGSQSHVL